MGNTQKKIKKELKKQAPVKKNGDGSHTLNVVLITIAIVLSLAIIVAAAILIIGGIKDKLAKPEDIVSLEADHYEVDNGMLTYFYSSAISSFMQSQEYQLYGSQIDFKRPLSEQPLPGSTNETWHQYFLEQAMNEANEYLLLAEGAYADGVKLDDEDKKQIDEFITSIENEAETFGLSVEEYIENIFGEDITVDSIRKAAELAKIADKQREALMNSFEITTEECEAYYEENKTSFDKVDICCYTVSASTSADGSQPASDEAKASAEVLKTATSEDEFIELVYQELIKKNATLESPLDETTLRDTAKGTKTLDYTNTGIEADAWLFDAERKAGDTEYFAQADGSYTVYFLINPAHRDEYNLKSVRHILINTSTYPTIEEADAKRDELQAAWDASDKTEEAFEKLAEEYNEDSNSLYENIAKGQMVEAFNDWCFDEARKPGDCEMVTTEYGYHLIYFVENGDVAWEATAKQAVSQKKLTETIQKYSEKFDVEVDPEKALKVRDYNFNRAPEMTTAAPATEAATEAATEPVTEAVTEPTTEAVTDAITDAITDAVSE